jgi:hypothetical protein
MELFRWKSKVVIINIFEIHSCLGSNIVAIPEHPTSTATQIKEKFWEKVCVIAFTRCINGINFMPKNGDAYCISKVHNNLGEQVKSYLYIFYKLQRWKNPM